MRLIKLNESNIQEIILMESDSDTSRFILPYDDNKHREEINKEQNLYLGIYENGILSGFIILGIEDNGSRIEFRRIVVKEKGNGIGQRAIYELENFCKDFWNTKSIWLDVFEDNKRGIHIYKKIGYELKSKSKFNSRNLLIMEKEL